MTQPTQTDPQFKLRLPAALKDRVQIAAATNNRSMNAEIVSSLEEKYPAHVMSAEFLVKYLQKLTEPMSLEEQIMRLEATNSTLAGLGVDLRAHLVDGEITLSKTP